MALENVFGLRNSAPIFNTEETESIQSHHDFSNEIESDDPKAESEILQVVKEESVDDVDLPLPPIIEIKRDVLETPHYLSGNNMDTEIKQELKEEVSDVGYINQIQPVGLPTFEGAMMTAVLQSSEPSSIIEICSAAFSHEIKAKILTELRTRNSTSR